MKEEKKESPIGTLWGWGKPYHGKFIVSVILAVLGVACQMIPYFCVAHIVTLMLSGEQDFSSYMAACIVALCGYLGKVIFANLSTVISHTATYYTLRDLRENITAKLARVPMGTILDTPSGQYKTTIVDRVEGMEPTFAHLIPGNDCKCASAACDRRVPVPFGLAHGASVPCYAGGGPCCYVCWHEELSRQMGGRGQSGKADGKRHCRVHWWD